MCLASTGGAAARSAMAVHTAACILLLSLGILFARPEQGLMDGVIDAGAGGLAIRSLLPIVFVLPLLLAWLSWLGVRLGWYSPSVAMALFVALTANALSYASVRGVKNACAGPSRTRPCRWSFTTRMDASFT